MPVTPPATPPTTLNDYLSSLDIGDPTLGGYLGSSISGLLGAVPPAGQYITSMDYTTLFPALQAQYVGEVIQKYEAILGPSPELYDAAVKAGALTHQQAAAMAATSQGTVGTLQRRFGAQGGLRAMAGPYTAQRTELLTQALADIQSASSKASQDAYTLASNTTGQRIQALTSAGNIGSTLSGQGVSRRNAQTAAEAAGPPEAPPMEFPAPPAPPVPPAQPSIWEKILAASIPAGIAGVAGVAGRLLAPGEKSPEEKAALEKRYQAAMKGDQFAEAQANPGFSGQQEHAGASDYAGYQPTQNVSNPFAGQYNYAGTPLGYSAYPQTMQELGYQSPFDAVGGGGYNGPGYSIAAPTSYDWQQTSYAPAPQQSYDYGSYSQPAPVDYGSYGYGGGGGGYGGYDYGYGGGYGTPDYFSNGGDQGSYTPDYYPDYSQSYGGYY